MNRKLFSLALFAMFGTAAAVDLSQYGLVLGGAYSFLGGGDAKDMAVYLDGVEFEDGREPFGYTNDTKKDPSGSFGPVAGAFVRLDWNDLVYSRIELYYLWKGAEYQKTIDASETYYGGPTGENMADTIASIQSRLDEEGEGEILDGMRKFVLSSSYLELPLLVGFNISKEFSVFAGPHISYLLSNTFDVHVTESDSYKEEELIEGKKSYTKVKLKENKVDFGATIGLGYIFSDQFQLTLRYAPGFAKMLDRSNAPSITQNTIQLAASLNFSEF